MTMLAEIDVDTATVIAPPKPTSLESTGLSPDTIASIIVKTLHSGEENGMGLSDRLCLPYGILEPLLEKLRV